MAEFSSKDVCYHVIHQNKTFIIISNVVGRVYVSRLRPNPSVSSDKTELTLIRTGGEIQVHVYGDGF